MQRVISHLHDQGVTPADLAATMGQLPLVPDMPGLLQQLAARRGEGERRAG